MEKHYMKLRGKIVEKGYGIGSFANALGCSRTMLYNMLSGRAEFGRKWIEKSRSLLDIETSEIGVYFFE